jgi:hypothetical protein
MERQWQHTTRELTDDLQISTAMAGAMVSNKTRVAGLGVVGLSKGSARIAYLTKAQIQFKLLAIGIITASPTGKKPKAYLGISKTSITESVCFGSSQSTENTRSGNSFSSSTGCQRTSQRR